MEESYEDRSGRIWFCTYKRWYGIYVLIWIQWWLEKLRRCNHNIVDHGMVTFADAKANSRTLKDILGGSN